MVRVHVWHPVDPGSSPGGVTTLSLHYKWCQKWDSNPRLQRDCEQLSVSMETRSGGTAPRAASARDTGTRQRSSASSRSHTPVVVDRTDRLEHIMKSVVDCQRRQQDQIDVEAQRHDQRWKAMEHQFHQLLLVRGETAPVQTVRQSLAELQPAQLPPLFNSRSTSPRFSPGCTSSTATSRSSTSVRTTELPELLCYRPSHISKPPSGVENPQNVPI